MIYQKNILKPILLTLFIGTLVSSCDSGLQDSIDENVKASEQNLESAKHNLENSQRSLDAAKDVEKKMNKKSWIKNATGTIVLGIASAAAYDYIKSTDINLEENKISVPYPINVTNDQNERVVLEPGDYDISENHDKYIKVIGNNNSNNTFIIMKEDK